MPFDHAKEETVYLLEKLLRAIMSAQLHLKEGAQTHCEVVFRSSVLFQTFLTFTFFQWTSVAGVDADFNLSPITKQFDLSNLESLVSGSFNASQCNFKWLTR